MEQRYKTTNGFSDYYSTLTAGRRRTLPELPMTPPISSPSLSQRSAQSDYKAAWSKSPYNRYNYTSNPCLSQSFSSTRYSSYPKLGSSKYRDAPISRSFDQFSSPPSRVPSPFRNPSVYDRMRSRDHSLQRMYRNYVSNNDLIQRYQSQSQPASPLRHRDTSRSYLGYRDSLQSDFKHRFDFSSSPGSSSGYASWLSRNSEDPLLRSSTRFDTSSPTISSPSRCQRLREIVAKSNANYYNLRESYSRLHQIAPSPPMSPLTYHSSTRYPQRYGPSATSSYSRSLLGSRDYFDDKDHRLSYPNDFSSPTYDRYLSHDPLYNEPTILRRQFILDMLRLLFRSEYTNLVYSPYSLQAILTMLVPGSGGNSRTELIRGLFDPMVDELCDAETLVHKFSTSHRIISRRNSSCLMVNNIIYVDQRKNLNPTYMEILRNDFSTLAKSVNFSDRLSSAKTINTDVYRATKGHIPDVIRPTDIHENTSVVLVNTVYFKSFWADHCSFFTNGRRFRTASGKAIFTKFLIRKGRLLYCYDPDLRTQVVQLELANPHLAMTLFLPDDEYLPITSFVADYLSMAHFDRILNNLHQDYVDLVIPEFKLALTHTNFAHQLKCLGIRDVFDESRADLHRMLGTYSRAGVSKVVQKVVMEVNERGSDPSTGASLLDMEMISNPRRSPQYQEFHADRPFLFALTTTEGTKKEVLLMGVMLDPLQRL